MSRTTKFYRKKYKSFEKKYYDMAPQLRDHPCAPLTTQISCAFSELLLRCDNDPMVMSGYEVDDKLALDVVLQAVVVHQ